MSMITLFKEIWEEREHVSEISGRPLLPPGHFLWHFQFSHTLTKGNYGRYKHQKFNIVLMLPDEHTFYENFTEKYKEKTMYLAHKEKWDALFELEEQLKQKYHREKRIK